jgi:hypothetical protein
MPVLERPLIGTTGRRRCPGATAGLEADRAGLCASGHVGGQDVVGVAVEVLASPVVAQVRESACRAAICTSRRSTPASSMVVTCLSMCWYIRGSRTPPGRRGGVAGGWRHGGILTRRVLSRIDPQRSVADDPVDGTSYGGRERDEDDPSALAHHAQHAVAVSLTQVVDVGAGGFEDPQPRRPSLATRAKSLVFEEPYARQRRPVLPHRSTAQ